MTNTESQEMEKKPPASTLGRKLSRRLSIVAKVPWMINAKIKQEMFNNSSGPEFLSDIKSFDLIIIAPDKTQRIDTLQEIVEEIDRKKAFFNNLTDDTKFSYLQCLERKCELLNISYNALGNSYNALGNEMKHLNKTLVNEMKHLNKTLVNEMKYLNKTLYEERDLRFFYQSLIDFTELIKGLVEECYPVWAKPRREDDFTDEIFETMFLNVEHDRILLLKIELKDANVLEADFIKIARDFLKFGNKTVHKPLSNTEREKAYPELIRNVNKKQNAVLRSILRYSYNVHVDDCKVETLPDAVPKFSTSEPLPTTINPRNLPLAEIIIHNTNEIRKNRNLMVITNPQTWMLNEDNLHNELSTNKLPEDDPLACYVPNKKEVYILFKDFGSAYKALENLKRKEEIFRGTNEKKTNYLIRTVHDFSLNDKNSVLKLEFSIGGDDSIQKSATKLNTFIAELMIKVKNCLNNIHPNVAYQIGKNRNHHEVFLKFDNMETLLIAYGKLKKKNFLGMVTIIGQNPDSKISTVNIYPVQPGIIA